MSAPKRPALTSIGPIPVGLQRLLRAACLDPGSLEALVTARCDWAASQGIALTLTERAILDAVPEAQLRRLIASVPDHDVGWEDPGDVRCGGIMPDMPAPRPDVAPDGSWSNVPTGSRPDMPPPCRSSPEPPPRAPSLWQRLRRLIFGG